MSSTPSITAWLFGPASGYLRARWVFIRALGLIFFSAFYSLAFQIDGLVGPHGILPAKQLLQYAAAHIGVMRYGVIPTLFWLGSGSVALKAACWAGMIASLLMTFNIWPRGMSAICTVLYCSFVNVLQVFSSYQSDGMLLEAGLLTIFLAPPGLRPGLGEDHPSSRASRFLLLYLCFRIYFESGLAKMLSGDPHWRNFTAMDDYYSNGPLPTWIGWYAQQLPHGWHAFCSGFTLFAELALVWLFWLPRRFRIAAFWIFLPFQSAITLTANYAFINHITIALSVLLLDDRHLGWLQNLFLKKEFSLDPSPRRGEGMGVRHLFLPAVVLTWLFYANTALLANITGLPLPTAPAVPLEPFRFANRYGLFAVMTPARYEIEFQGSHDGKTWTPYPFRYKPQDPKEAPRIYAPYQPRFDWNLWFASLEPWRQNPWVLNTEERLLENDPAVVSLFRSNPFPDKPPRVVRTLFWQYTFTDLGAKRTTGAWWRRKELGQFAPSLEKGQDGQVRMAAGSELPG